MNDSPNASPLPQLVPSNGDSDSFEDLYHRHVDTVYRIIAKIVLNESTAHDLTQDTFVKAAAHLHQFKGNASFKTWLCRIAVNTANEHLRKIITARRHLNTLSAAPEPHSGHKTPRDSLFWKEENQRVTAALEALDPPLRTALVLTVIEGMDPRDAADIQGCTRSTLYWRIHQARKALKKALAIDPEKDWGKEFHHA